jgi:WD40 repeat protein
VSAGFDGNVILWDIAGGRQVGSFRGHAHRVWRVAFSRDGRRVVSGSQDGMVRLWDVKSGEEIRQYNAGEGGAMGIAFLPDGTGVVSTRCGGVEDDWPAAQSAVAVWPADPASAVVGAEGIAHPITAAAVSDNRIVLIGTAGGTVAVWDGVAKRKLVTLAGHAGAVRAVSFARDGRHALTAGEDGAVRLLDVETGTEIRSLAGEPDGVRGATFIAGSDRALLGEAGGGLRVWEPATGGLARPVATFGGSETRITAWAVSPGGRRMLVVCDDRTAYQCDLTPGAAALPDLLPVKLGATLLAWSPELHSALYTVSPPPAEFPGLLCLADLASGDKRQLLGHEVRVTAVAFSADGTAALSGDEGGTVILWDVPERKQLRTFRAHRGAVNAIAFSPGGGCAVSAGADKTFKLWDFEEPIEGAALENRVRAARTTLTRSPADPAALATFVEWHAFRGKDDWAMRLADRAGSAAPISHLALGRCYWRLGDLARANAEFKKAMEQKEGDAFCTRLCVRATAPDAGMITSSSASVRP